MSFRDLFLNARAGNEAAVVTLLEMYKPLLIKEAIYGGRFDEDLYQELCITFLNCIRMFRM